MIERKTFVVKHHEKVLCAVSVPFSSFDTLTTSKIFDGVLGEVKTKYFQAGSDSHAERKYWKAWRALKDGKCSIEERKF